MKGIKTLLVLIGALKTSSCYIRNLKDFEKILNFHPQIAIESDLGATYGLKCFILQTMAISPFL